MSTEKRLFLFLVLTFMVLAGYAALMEVFGPKPPAPQDQQAAQKDPGVEEKPEGKGPEAPKPEIQDAAKGQQPANPAVVAEEPKDDAPQPVAHPHRVITVGRYAPAIGESPLLMTLNSRGAALERVELVGRKKNGELIYRDLDNTSGYVGNLSLVAEPGSGCRVQAVAAGTPAASATATSGVAAGLLPGDVLTHVNGKLIELPSEFDDELNKLRPNDTVKLTVERKVGARTEKFDVAIKLDVRPFQLVRPEPLEKGEIKPHPLSLLVSVRDTTNERTGFLDKLQDVEWETKVEDQPVPTVEFRYAIRAAEAREFGLAGPVEVVKRYRVGVNGPNLPNEIPSTMLPYHVDFELELRNIGTQPQSLAYRLDGPNGLPTEGWWFLTKLHPDWFTSAGARDVVLRTAESPRLRLIGASTLFSRMQKDEKSPKTPLFSENEPAENRTVQFIGIDHQYFDVVFLPIGSQPGGSAKFSRAEAFVWGDVTKKPKHWERTANSTFQLWSEPATLEGNQSVIQQFKIFAGPKDPHLLSRYGLQNTIYYGWSIFGEIAKILSMILHFFYAIFGNYGIAIVLLTVVVRGLMFPVSRTAARNAAMMQELAPEMRKIAEKHKNNLEARGKAQQELFRQHNYNPLSGCWLMFLQLPVFIGLYRCLAVDIELRQAPLIPGIEWCSNLAGPDKLFYWKNDFFSYFTDESGWLGPYFNLLPLFTIVLFLVHQKMFTPPATDEQTEMQMKMMKFMTVFMGVLFYKVPAGLCLYFITSSLWGIAERKLLPKPTPKKKDEGGGGSKLAALFGPRKPPPDENGNARKKELERKLRRNK